MDDYYTNNAQYYTDQYQTYLKGGTGKFARVNICVFASADHCHLALFALSRSKGSTRGWALDARRVEIENFDSC